MLLYPGVWLLDVFTHANFEDRMVELIQALEMPQGRLVAHTDAQMTPKVAALEAEGFARETVLGGMLRGDAGTRDVWVYSKENG